MGNKGKEREGGNTIFSYCPHSTKLHIQVAVQHVKVRSPFVCGYVWRAWFQGEAECSRRRVPPPSPPLPPSHCQTVDFPLCSSAPYITEPPFAPDTLTRVIYHTLFFFAPFGLGWTRARAPLVSCRELLPSTTAF